jgi:hypothetical protein
MIGQPAVELSPIADADIERVAEFLHKHLNSRVSVQAWATGIEVRWLPDAPNHGFMLSMSGDIVGVNLAFYSSRRIGGQVIPICNLGALCVREDQRGHTFRLVLAVLAQRGYHFTDLSPSGNVILLNERLGFKHVDTTTALVVNAPWPRTGSARVICDDLTIEKTLVGADLETFRDHRNSPAAHHFVVAEDAAQAYIVLRRDRRKGLPIFASVLYVSNAELFRRRARLLFSHVLTHVGAPFTLLETRLAHYRPFGSVPLRHPRPRMYKSPVLAPDTIDYLYSELTQIAW